MHMYGTAEDAAVALALPIPSAPMRIRRIMFGYDDTPTAGSIVVTAAGATVFEMPITEAGPGPMPMAIDVAADAKVVVTLAAGGAGVNGHLYVEYVF